jgi:prephenate dehydrogenase
VTIGIVGYGRFGRLAARYLSREAHVFVYDTRPAGVPRASKRIHAAPLPIVASRPVVILAVPVSSMREALRAMAPYLVPGSLLIDVGAVKSLPSRWMKAAVPASVSILATHPLFGPDSAARSLRGRIVVLCPVRIGAARLRAVRRALHRKGVVTRVMKAEEHDRMAAETILATQYVGRLVAHAHLTRWPAVTANYARLLAMVEIARKDSVDLFVDMARYNPHGRAVARAFKGAQALIGRELAAERAGGRGLQRGGRGRKPGSRGS